MLVSFGLQKNKYKSDFTEKDVAKKCGRTGRSYINENEMNIIWAIGKWQVQVESNR